MRFPVHDVEFWVVTAFFLVAAGYLLRNVIPIPGPWGRGRRRKREQKATLTISAKHPPNQPPTD